MNSDTLYHKCLRGGAVIVAFVLLFQNGGVPLMDSKTAQDSRLFLANTIGMSAGVAPTELNSITAELTKRGTELDAREAALREREINARANDTSTSFAVSNYVLSGILLLLLILITMNYLFDFLRARTTEKYAATS